MKKPIITAGIMIIGLTAPAVGSPEEPTLIETATFLITGKRANEFEVMEDRRTLGRDLRQGSILESIFKLGNYEYLSAVPGEEENCIITRFFTDEKYTYPFDMKKIKSAQFYFFNKLNGDQRREIYYNGFTETYAEKETSIGNSAYCTTSIGDDGDWKEKCFDNMEFTNPVTSSETRKKAWNYLYSAHCKLTKQPF